MKRSLSDFEAVVLAGAVGCGVWLDRPIPLALAAGTVAAALTFRRPWMLCIGGLLLASALGYRAQAGLAPPAARPFSGTVTLASDPEPSFGGVQAVAKAGGHRYELTARRGAGGSLRSSLAGEQLQVAGRLRPLGPGQDWLASRHVVGRLDATKAERTGPGGPVWRLANGLRRTLTDGAASMNPTQRSLFAGFVLGDDRDQPVTTTDDFRGSGLTHLLAVSGENVAFVLTLAGPLLRRLSLTARWAATLGLIGFFAVLTRFEPSVLRASVMAGLAATAVALGRPATSVRILALAVAALLLIDPLLIRSVGFLLSASACAGIVLVAARLADVLPGPRVVVQALSVTIAAQLGVAPVQLATFGGLPVASFPANLLAAPAAALVMTWGLGAGIAAGLAGGGLATALHLPTRLFIGWIEVVARTASSLPLGQLQWPQVLALSAGLALLLLAWRVDHRGRADPGHPYRQAAVPAPPPSVADRSAGRGQSARLRGSGVPRVAPSAIPAAGNPAAEAALSTGNPLEPATSRGGGRPGDVAASEGARPALRAMRLAGAVLFVGALLAPSILAGSPLGFVQPADGVRLWRGGGATVVQISGVAQPEDVLGGLRRAGVRRLDLVVMTGGGSRSAGIERALHHRWTIGDVWAPPDNQLDAARAPPKGTVVGVGSLRVQVLRSRPHLEVRVTVVPASR